MNQKQYTRVMHEIDTGAEIRGSLFNEGSGHCIMGNLLHKLGVPAAYLEGAYAPAAISDVSENWNDGEYMDMEVAIAQRFGLASEHQDKMMHINDMYTSTTKRRAALRQYMVKTFPKVHAKYLASKAKVKKATVKVDTAATKLINALVAAKPAKRRCTCGCGQMTHVPAREKVAA